MSEIKISPQQYNDFMQELSKCDALSGNRFKWLGHGKAYNDSCVIEVAILDTPVRLSFKFKKNQPLRCCINLRPDSRRLGDAGSKEPFGNWVKAQYGNDAKIRNEAKDPYFKPYGHPPEKENGKTEDIFFEIGTAVGDDICLTRTAKVGLCPEFPAQKDSVTVQLTLIEAVNRILQRLR